MVAVCGSQVFVSSAANLVTKEFFEPLGRQGRIARRILNIAMPEIGLDRARVVASAPRAGARIPA